MGGRVGGCPPCLFISKGRSFRDGWSRPGDTGHQAAGWLHTTTLNQVRVWKFSQSSQTVPLGPESLLLFSFAECTRDTRHTHKE